MAYKLNNFCRLCATMVPESALLFLQDNSKTRAVIMSQLALLKCNVDWSRTDLPETICATCGDSLQSAFEFVNIVETAQNALNKMLLVLCYKTEKDEVCDETELCKTPEHHLLCSTADDDPEDPCDQNVKEEDEKIFEENVIGNDSFLDDPVIVVKEENNIGFVGHYRIDENVDFTVIGQHETMQVDIQSEGNYIASVMDKEKINIKSEEGHYRIDEKADVTVTGQHENMQVVIQKINIKSEEDTDTVKKTVHGETKNNMIFDEHTLTHLRKQPAELKKLTQKRNKKPNPSLSSEDLTCMICRKFFKDMTKLKQHVKTHVTNRPRDHVCNICKKAFVRRMTLVEHQKIHSPKSVVCQICGFKFISNHRLRQHLVTHTEDRPFRCKECGNCFKTKKRLNIHMRCHSNVKPYKCAYCEKEFRLVHCMKMHELQHTGVRPYTCEVCDRTFTNWTNCNKHMIRKHGVTLAKTKMTPTGRVSINRKTGEAKNFAMDDKAKERLNKVLRPKKLVIQPTTEVV